ncbi:MAG: hypothetical protein HY554_06490 [Elusimicrobia bacterium]|nr:hypothetical protein [Elusimicrobiota bacterium]
MAINPLPSALLSLVLASVSPARAQEPSLTAGAEEAVSALSQGLATGATPEMAASQGLKAEGHMAGFAAGPRPAGAVNGLRASGSGSAVRGSIRFSDKKQQRPLLPPQPSEGLSEGAKGAGQAIGFLAVGAPLAALWLAAGWLSTPMMAVGAAAGAVAVGLASWKGGNERLIVAMNAIQGAAYGTLFFPLIAASLAGHFGATRIAKGLQRLGIFR